MPKSFLFYDFETDGAQPSACRPYQFACIRTSHELEPIGDEEVLWCRPATDRLPAPEACLITGITPQKAAARGTTEAAFFDEIHSLVSRSQTTSLGWNSLRFDDLVCRFGFWRTFHDPYGHTWRDGCAAWDLIDLARAAQALRPEGINWPLREDGAPSFRLDMLAPANDIEHGDAHDALADVRATIEFGRMLRDQQPDLWTWAQSLTDTRKVETMLDGSDPLVHVSARIPAEIGCTSPIRMVAHHPQNKRSFICWDLRHDPTELLKADADEIARRTFTREVDLASGETRFPLKQVKSNRAPFLAPAGVLKSADVQRLDLDEDRWRAHDAMLTSDPGVMKQLARRLQEAWKPEHVPAEDPDDAIYGGFPPDHDLSLRDKVSRSPARELADLGTSFRDPRLQSLMLHYRARNHPGTLTANEQATWKSRCQERLMTPPGRDDLPWPTWLDHVRTLGQEPGRSSAEQELLASVEAWGLELAQQHGLPAPAST